MPDARANNGYHVIEEGFHPEQMVLNNKRCFVEKARMLYTGDIGTTYKGYCTRL